MFDTFAHNLVLVGFCALCFGASAFLTGVGLAMVASGMVKVQREDDRFFGES